ncbi:MAG: glycosyltransferase [Candidatus Obscuribacterales bacterium]|nr:glycosyltransferase [Candidatus Obscuribacterales bacterium]
MKPLVSVFMPTCARYRNGMLKAAVDSVLEQDYEHFEFLVVDDGSVDGTREYLQELSAQDSRVKHIRFDKNVGLPALTLAKALLESKGDYLAFNFDDTVLRKDCLSKLVNKMAAEPKLEMAYGQTIMHMPNGNIVYGKEPDLDELKKFNFIGNASVMLRRSVITRVGWYDPHILLKRSCDWDLWLRIFKSSSVGFLPEVLSDEYGQSLTDSFRRSYYIFQDLVDRYVETNRDSMLSPEALVSGQYSITNMSIASNAEEKKQLYMACLEHFVRVLDSDNITKIATDLLASDYEDVQLLWQRMNMSNGDVRGSADKAQLLMLGTNYYYSNKLTAAQSLLHEHESELRDVSHELGELKDKYHALLRSVSWRLTKPLRETMVRLSRRQKESQHV